MKNEQWGKICSKCYHYKIHQIEKPLKARPAIKGKTEQKNEKKLSIFFSRVTDGSYSHVNRLIFSLTKLTRQNKY